jgi:hypothetical protein
MPENIQSTGATPVEFGKTDECPVSARCQAVALKGAPSFQERSAAMPRLTRFTDRRVVGCAVVWAMAWIIACAPAICRAQATKGAADHTDSRIDLYAGYGYFHPINSGIDGFQYQDISNPNVTVGVAGWFNQYIGLEAEGAYFSGDSQHAIYNAQAGVPCNRENCSQLMYTAEGGPIFRLPLGAFIPFIHTLGGGVRINGPVEQPLFWGWGVTGGAGLDIVLPPFNHRFAIRAVQADWQYSQVVYGPLVLPAGIHGGFGEIDALKLSGGIVTRFSEAKGAAPVQLGCSVTPLSVFPGDPLIVNGTTLNTNSKLKPTYTWTVSGGKVVGGGLNPTIDTAGMAPGDYVVKGHLSEGPHARQQADCDAPFTVRKFDPPTIACTATPNVALSGTQIAISTSGGSPQNRPLTYSYAATEGQIAANGPTATLATAGLSPTTITITCNVVDDFGQSAQSKATVTVNAPPAPVVISTQPLCDFSFDHDKRRPARVDNQGSACLDDVAIALTQQTDAHLVIVGDYLAPESSTLGAERAINARLYLTRQKGIDPSRIQLRVGSGTGKVATDTLVPPGAIFNEIGTHPFDDSTIKPSAQPYGLGVRHTPANHLAGKSNPSAAKPHKAAASKPKATAKKPAASKNPFDNLTAPKKP